MLNIGDRWWFIFEILLTHHYREAINTSEPRPQPIGIIMDGGVNSPVHDDLILFTCEAISQASAGRLTANGIDGKPVRPHAGLDIEIGYEGGLNSVLIEP